eukprot:jgi/Bigna1/86307/estExt_fgenesh1_pg.C_90247
MSQQPDSTGKNSMELEKKKRPVGKRTFLLVEVSNNFSRIPTNQKFISLIMKGGGYSYMHKKRDQSGMDAGSHSRTMTSEYRHRSIQSKYTIPRNQGAIKNCTHCGGFLFGAVGGPARHSCKAPSPKPTDFFRSLFNKQTRQQIKMETTTPPPTPKPTKYRDILRPKSPSVLRIKDRSYYSPYVTHWDKIRISTSKDMQKNQVLHEQHRTQSWSSAEKQGHTKRPQRSRKGVRSKSARVLLANSFQTLNR